MAFRLGLPPLHALGSLSEAWPFGVLESSGAGRHDARPLGPRLRSSGREWCARSAEAEIQCPASALQHRMSSMDAWGIPIGTTSKPSRRRLIVSGSRAGRSPAPARPPTSSAIPVPSPARGRACCRTASGPRRRGRPRSEVTNLEVMVLVVAGDHHSRKDPRCGEARRSPTAGSKSPAGAQCRNDVTVGGDGGQPRSVRLEPDRVDSRNCRRRVVSRRGHLDCPRYRGTARIGNEWSCPLRRPWCRSDLDRLGLPHVGVAHPQESNGDIGLISRP